MIHLSVVLVLLGGLLMPISSCQPAHHAGGASHRKAEQARRQAEQLAEAALRGAAEASMRSAANTGSRRRLQRWWQQTRQLIGLHTTPDNSAPAPLVVQPIEPPIEINPPVSRPATRQPKSPPRPGPVAVIRERIVNRVPRPSENDALEDALLVAAELLAQRLAELDPPLDVQLTPEEIRQHYIRWDSREVIPFGQRLRQQEPRALQLKPLLELVVTPAEMDRLVDVEFDVEVTSEQLRQLRSYRRSELAFSTIALVTFALGAIYLLLQLHEWSKGYLTRWLWLGAALLFLLAVAIWYYVLY
jgi:hypothetical protein